MPRHHDTRSTSGPAKGDGSSTKMRRSHRKSRNGCSECKRRHIRCDEGRPSCTNCSIAERTCSYPTPGASPAQQQQKQIQTQTQTQQPSPASTSQIQSPAGSYAGSSGNIDVGRPIEPHVVIAATSLSSASNTPSEDHRHWHLPPTASTPAAITTLPSFHESFDTNLVSNPQPAAAIFTAQHMRLLKHAMTSMNESLMNVHDASHIVDIALRESSHAPYLLDQVLALSAMHHAWKYPESADVMRHEATELQNRSVASFMRETETLPDDQYHCVQRFLFSSVLSMHVLAETLSYHRQEFHGFIARFVECIDLHRGILSVVHPNWAFLLETELKPYLSITIQAADRERNPPGAECAPLEHLLSHSDLSPSSIAACRGAVERLQWAFDLYAKIDHSAAPHATSGFAVTVGADYVDVLRRQRPEALIILAYFGVLVHRSRKFWVFRDDTGAYMIRAIAQHLGGGYWREPMQWPLEVLENETD